MNKSITINGVGYSSIKISCEAHGVPYATYKKRMQKGWEQVAAITTPPEMTRKSITIDGVEYSGIKSACAAHGVGYGIYKKRRKAGWEKAKAITTPPEVQRTPIIVDGVKYPSLGALCRNFGVPWSVYKDRVCKCNWTPEQAVGLESRYADGDEQCFGKIYLVTQLSTGKKYVGQTMHSIEERWVGHVNTAKNGGKTHLSQAIRKNGESDFTIVLLSRHQTRDELNAAEVEAIATHDTLNPAGLNSTKGGSGWVCQEKMQIVWKGKKYRSVAAICRAEGVPYGRVQSRMYAYCLSLEEAIENPLNYSGSKAVIVNGVKHSSRNAAARAYGMSPSLVKNRVQKLKWPLEKALTTPLS